MQVISGGPTGAGLIMGEIEGAREGTRSISKTNLLTGQQKQWKTVVRVIPSAGEDPADLTEDNAISAVGIPPLRTVIDSAYLVSKTAREVDSVNGQWDVELVFDSEIPADEPTLQYEWDTEEIEVVLVRDPVTGAPIVNTIGQPLLLTDNAEIQILRVTKVVDTFNPTQLFTYSNTVNSVAFGVFPANTCLLTIKDHPVTINGVQKRQIEYQVKINLLKDPATGIMLGWRVQLLNHGTKANIAGIPGTPGEEIVNTKDFYNGLTDANLDLNGRVLDPSAPPIWLTFNRKRRTNWPSVINIWPY